jgi:hypothetical protein
MLFIKKMSSSVTLNSSAGVAHASQNDETNAACPNADPEKILDVYYFIHHPDLCVKVEDFMNLLPKQMVDLCMFDSNFEESRIWSPLIKNDTPYRPTYFFADNHHRYRHIGENVGRVAWRDESRYQLIYDFSVEVMPGKWQNLDNKCGKCEENIVKIENVMPSSRIGWRGPMVLWSVIEQMERDGYTFKVSV